MNRRWDMGRDVEGKEKVLDAKSRKSCFVSWLCVEGQVKARICTFPSMKKKKPPTGLALPLAAPCPQPRE